MGYGLAHKFAPGLEVSTAAPPSVADLILGGGINSASGASSVHSVVHSDAASLSGSEHTLDPGAVGLSSGAGDRAPVRSEYDTAGPRAVWGQHFDPQQAHSTLHHHVHEGAMDSSVAGTRASSTAGTPNLAGVPAVGGWGAPPPPMTSPWTPAAPSKAQDMWMPQAYAAPPTSLPLPPYHGIAAPPTHAPPPYETTRHYAHTQPGMYTFDPAAEFGTASFLPYGAQPPLPTSSHFMGLPGMPAHPYGQAQQMQPQHYMHMGPSAHTQVLHQLHGATPLRQLHAAVQHHSAPGKSRGKRKAKSSSLDTVFMASPVDIIATPAAVAELARDQTGSRYIQFRFERGSTVEAGVIAQELLSDFEVMARDAFGNYAVQKIMDSKRQQCSQGLVAAALRDCVMLSEHVYGCRVVQKAIEVCSAAEWKAFSSVLQEHLMRFVYHEHGNHVVQKWVQSCPGRGQLADALLVKAVGNLKNHCSTLALHMYGCRVLQRVVEAAPQPLLKKQLYPPLLRKAATLVLDQFGNFVLQHMLAHGDDSTRAAVAKALTPGVVKAAGHKCASNVLERLLECCAAQEVDAVVWQVLRGAVAPAAHKQNLVDVSGYKLLQPSVARSSPVRSLLIDRFGNYVLQKALAVAPMSSRVALADAIRVNAEVLTSLSFGQAIVDRAMAILIASGILRAVGAAAPAPCSGTAAAVGSGGM